MGRKLHLPESFEQQDFLKMMRKMRHGRNRIRLLAMHHIQTGIANLGRFLPLLLLLHHENL